jgi:voltage-gated potassium channel
MTLERWERASEAPLAVAAVLFLIAYAWPILDPHLVQPARAGCKVVNYGVWAFFALDYIARIYLAKGQRGHYALRHALDLVMIALPVLRPLRLLRVVMLLRFLNRQATDSLTGRVAIYVSGGTVLIVFCAGLAVLDAERGKAGANISSFGDALWWATTTITTVGYGDHYPVTTEGRFVAVGLMLAGIALLGVVTASIASWLIGRVRQIEVDNQSETREDLAGLRDEIRALRGELAEMRAQRAANQVGA